MLNMELVKHLKGFLFKHVTSFLTALHIKNVSCVLQTVSFSDWRNFQIFLIPSTGFLSFKLKENINNFSSFFLELYLIVLLNISDKRSRDSAEIVLESINEQVGTTYTE